MFPKLSTIISYLDSLTERVNLEELRSHLMKIEISRADIQSACIFGAETYKRNLVSSSPWYELLVMCWRPGQRSKIHDHGLSACGVKVIEGTLTETRFSQTSPGQVKAVDACTYEAGAICVRVDSDIHEMSNEGDSDMITLHLYSPVLKMNFYQIDKTLSLHDTTRI